MANPKVVLLVFSSGKIVLTGAKKREEIHEAYTKIKALLKKHRSEE
jgi:transcription initiation factor TFIID TATA-box-binding protein